MITVIDLEISNIGSVARALDSIKAKYIITNNKDDIKSATKIMLPGVGSFLAGAEALTKFDLRATIHNKAIKESTPVFGVCLGMQLLATTGIEGGVTSEGLNLIEGHVQLLDVDTKKYTIPHMGWNNVNTNNLNIFKNIPNETDFYFVHSFHLRTETQSSYKAATVDYGETKINAAVEKNNIWACQFHPEKSQKYGLQILKNFVDL